MPVKYILFMFSIAAAFNASADVMSGIELK